MKELTISTSNAKTIYIDSPDASYGIFCFNEIGDLFLNSDYGTYGFAWRAYGDNFEKFLSQCNAEYIMGKFEINYFATINKKPNKNWSKHATILIQYFIDHLKEQQVNNGLMLEAGNNGT